MGNPVICQLNTVADCLNLKVWGAFPSAHEKSAYFNSNNWKCRTLGDWLRTPPTNADAIKAAYDALPIVDGKHDKKAKDNPYQKLKAKTPGFQFAHTAKAREIDGLTYPSDLSGIYCIDIDDVPPEKMDTVKRQLLDLPSVFAVSVSVSQSGFAAFMLYDVSGAPETSDKEEKKFYLDCVFRACADYVDSRLGWAAADRSAKNPVRWRVLCPFVDIKPNETIIERVPVSLEKPAPKPKETKNRRLKTAQAALLGTNAADKEERNTRLQALIFAAFDAGLSDTDAEQQARESLEKVSPDSSRLQGDELRRFVAYLRGVWEKQKTKLKPREIAREYFVGYRYDTFKGAVVTPDGVETTIDAAAAACSRANVDISFNIAAETIITMVKENPAAQFDGLEQRVRGLAAAYTDADAETIERYANRCNYDAYERRRLRLWLYQVCGRALKRGEKTDCMLVLAGHTEGTKKTMFFNAISQVLTGADAAEYKFDGGKDSDILLSRSAVVVVDEIDKILRKTDVAELKAKITQTQSFVRAPYERDAKARSNSAVFGATTNDTHPVPAGESEARRYWVLNADCPVNFENTAEAESALRAAAHDTLAALEAHADKYDRLTVVGKIWVQSPNEERETAERNGAHKAQNASTVALNAGLFALKDILNTQSPWPRALFSASMWGAVFETGDALRIGGPRTWTPPKCKAADIAKMITDRCKRRVTTIKDNGVRKRTAGYSLLDLVYEFLNDYKQDAVSYRDGFDFADITDNQGPNGMHFV